MSFFSCFFLVSPLFDWSFGKLSPLDGMETRWNRGGGGGGGGGGGRETEETVSREGPRGVKKTWWPSTLLLFLFLIPFFSFSILPLLLFLLFFNIQVEKWMEREREEKCDKRPFFHPPPLWDIVSFVFREKMIISPVTGREMKFEINPFRPPFLPLPLPRPPIWRWRRIAI